MNRLGCVCVVLTIGMHIFTDSLRGQSTTDSQITLAKEASRTLIETAISAGDLPGAVVGFWHDGQWLVREAYGDRQLEPSREPMTLDTIFDMASITKPVATATSIMLLVQRGRLDLEAPVKTYLPQFTGEGRDAVCVKHLLRHTAGLIPDNALKDYQSGADEAWRQLLGSTIKTPSDEKFVYSDVGFLLLGKIVEAVSGQPLNVFANDNIFAPLKMMDTGYLPPSEKQSRIAPTEPRDGKMLRGEVHDPRAALLGGVAGHAGLFSTLDDLSRYAQMMLNYGRLADQQILTSETHALFTAAHRVEHRADFGWLTRTNGFDHHSTYSYNNGGVLSDAAFGHGGFTGTVLWIDPDRNCFFVFLSNRLHPDGKGNVNRLAGNVAKTIVEHCLKPLPQRDSVSQLQLGVDVLHQSGYRALRGQRLGLITNHTGRNSVGQPTSQLLIKAEGLQLTTLFSPEHGIQGLLDQSRIGDSTDQDLKLPIYSLYGDSRKPSAKQLENVDCLVYDIQDIGCRFYTYISTMKECMQAAAEQGKKFVVLDRPNPIGGVKVAGPTVDSGRESFVACHNIAVQHGMTVGELALMMRSELNLKLDLQVIPVRHWRRAQTLEETGLEWVDPSPNMRSLVAAALYPGIGLLETSNISVGRGTDRPFEWIGAPWIQSRQLAAWMNQQKLPGVSFIPRSMTPTSSKHANVACGGIQLLVTDDRQLDALLLGVTLATGLQQLYPNDWKAATIDTLLVNARVRDAIVAGTGVQQVMQLYAKELQDFMARRKTFLLYE